MTIREMAELSMKALDDKKADDVVGIDIQGLTVIADYFVLAKALNSTHARTVADEVDHQLELQGYKRQGIDGYNTEWILLDYGDLMIHVFYGEENGGYNNLMHLWADGKKFTLTEGNE